MEINITETSRSVLLDLKSVDDTRELLGPIGIQFFERCALPAATELVNSSRYVGDFGSGVDLIILERNSEHSPPHRLLSFLLKPTVSKNVSVFHNYIQQLKSYKTSLLFFREWKTSASDTHISQDICP